MNLYYFQTDKTFAVVVAESVEKARKDILADDSKTLHSDELALFATAEPVTVITPEEAEDDIGGPLSDYAISGIPGFAWHAVAYAYRLLRQGCDRDSGFYEGTTSSNGLAAWVPVGPGDCHHALVEEYESVGVSVVLGKVVKTICPFESADGYTQGLREALKLPDDELRSTVEALLAKFARN